MKKFFLLAALILTGCGVPHFTTSSSVTLTATSKQVGDTATAVSVASTQVSGTATQVVNDAKAGKSATPVNIINLLSPFWDRIISNGQILQSQGTNLDTISHQITALQAQIDLGNKEAETERTSLNQQIMKLTKDLADAKSSTQKMLHGFELGALILGGIAVGFGIYKADFHLVTAGVGGAITIVGLCILLGEIDRYKVQILIGLGVALLLVIIYEIYRYRKEIFSNPPTVKATS